MTYLIGIDLGTSAVKTIIMDVQGKILATALEEYPLYQPNNGWAEQDPNDWKNATLNSLKSVVKQVGMTSQDVVGIGLSGQMHGLVMLDEQGDVLDRSIIWCDQRTGKQVEKMLEIMPNEKWLDITANPPLAAWTAAKILWVRDNKPEVYQSCRKVLLPKDYIRYILTGIFATDVSDASGMQLLDVKNRCWSQEILERLQISPDLLPDVYESQEITGTLTETMAIDCGLPSSTIVVAGASDNAAAAVGTGTVNTSSALVSIGTSAILYTHLDRYVPIPEGNLHLCCCAVPGCWHTMGGPQSAGLSLQWFKNNFCSDYADEAKRLGISVYQYIDCQVEQIPVGANRLLYLPFLMGERTPHMNPDVRGVFLGLSAIHTKADLLRSIMEGVGYSLTDCANILKKEGVSIEQVRICGGGGKSQIWRQIIADLLKTDIYTLQFEEGPAFGVAILAGVALNIYPNVVEACNMLIKDKDVTKVNVINSDSYEKFHHMYNQVYNHLENDFSELAQL